MLLFPLLVACASDAEPVAPVHERKHHARTPDPVEADDDVAEGPPPLPSGNRVPLVRKVKLEPAKPDVSRPITATVDAVDPEGGKLEVDLQWMVDTRPVADGKDGTLDLGDYQRGSTVQLRVRATDSAGDVTEYTTDPVTIGNADPRFKVAPADIKRIDGLRLEAEDPDGDEVTFRIEGAPPGVTLDPRGVLHYQGAEEGAGGSYRLKIFAEDAHGGHARMELPLDISPGSKAAKPAAGAQ